MIDQFTAFEDEKTIKLKGDQSDRLVGNAVQELLRFQLQSEPYRNRYLETLELYLKNRPQAMVYDSPDSGYESSANMQRPVLAEAIDSVHAQIHQSMYPADERFFQVQALNRIAKDKQDLYEASVEDRLGKLAFILKTDKDELNALMAGVAAAAHPFVRKTKKRTQYKPILEAFGVRLGRKAVETEIVAYEGTDFVPLLLNDWWIDPTVDSFDDTPFTWRRWVCPEQLKAVKAYQNTDEVKPLANAEPSDQAASDTRTMYNYMGVDYTLEDTGIDEHMASANVLLYERWGDFYIDEKYYENHVLVWSNERTFHYFGPNPYDHGRKPFTVSPYIALPGTLFGKSLSQDIIPMCHALNTLLNMAIDILNAEADPTYTALAGDDVLWESLNEGKIPVGNGKYIWVKSHDSLNPIKKDLEGLKIIFDLMQSIKEEIRESTGGVPYTTGSLSPEADAKTATETSALVSGTSTRLQARIQNYELTKLTPYLTMWFENDRQFMSEPIMLPKFDDPLMPDDVKDMDVEIQVTGSKSVMNKQKDIQNWGAALQGVIPQLKEIGILTFKQEMAELDIIAMVKQFLRMQNVPIDDYLTVIQQPQTPGMGPQLPGAPGVPGAVPGMPPAGGLGGLALLPQAAPG